MSGRKGCWRTVQIIRHCTTALNSSDPTVDRIRGWSDYELSERGRAHARELAARVAQNPPDILLSSNLIRAEQTATVIAAVLGLDLEIPGDDFRPWHLGEFVGRKSAEALPVIARHAVEKPNEPVPGGESFNSFRSRFMNGLARAFIRHGGRIGIVTHHRCERLLRAWVKLGCPADGAIDEAEFIRRGEPTGYCGEIAIPLERLDAVIRTPSTMPAFGDGREEDWHDWANANR